ncbi:hypothetical protein [Aminobacter carboxidus]|uniref:Uncharacterized protein n=1 Tax=Aminobacter carboxidus TaxID=376165 RepID=A0ABR9GX27_9HYPH|nr:hypothetical protein [Aminobacter carboxidus]MBE1208170.1 hypothetical protein [Aminobacter carboxidus]
MSERIPCINPRCRRTFADDGKSSEIICGKCFRTLPEATRKQHRRYWRKIHKWERRITRTGDELNIFRMRAVRDTLSMRLNMHWDTCIKPFFLAPEKPAGLDAFFEEVGF